MKFLRVSIKYGKLRPVYGGGFQIFQREDADRDGLAVQRIGGVLRQGSGGNPYGKISAKKRILQVCAENRVGTEKGTCSRISASP